MKWTQSDIDNKLSKGTIQAASNRTVEPKTKVKVKMPAKISVEKMTLKLVLEGFCKDHGFRLIPEFQFHPHRKWRSDYFIPELSCLLEYEGLFSKKSRHTTIMGYSNDSLKYNAAIKMGFKLLRYTATTYNELFGDLNELLTLRGSASQPPRGI